MSDTFRHSLLFFLWLLQMRNDISENRFREPFGCQPWLCYLSRSAPSFLPPPAFYAFPNSKICEANYSLLRPLCIIAPKHKKKGRDTYRKRQREEYKVTRSTFLLLCRSNPAGTLLLSFRFISLFLVMENVFDVEGVTGLFSLFQPSSSSSQLLFTCQCDL